MSDLDVIDWDGPAAYRVSFATRRGGVSSGPYASLNLGLLTEDDPEHVRENRRRLCAEAGADPHRTAIGRQVHGADISRARPTGVLDGAAHPELRDGMWSSEAGQAMLVLSADCLPIAVCRTGETPALAAVHAGWRGLLAGILENAISALAHGPFAAVIGPGIGPCCYEVGSRVAARFASAYGADAVRGRNVDLWTCAERALHNAGCGTVDCLDVCTACDPDRFFSHRRDAGVTGRQGMIAFVR
ncbi:MAG: polyphenol oxidase family protein [Actinomycetia bacterium]|nr:polyphenol oxidase family protein [Actinomycetes bacterium]